MNNRTMSYIASATVAALFAGALWIGMRLPDAQLPIHWGLDGHPDGFAGKWVALMLTPAVTLFLCVLMASLPRLEPNRENLARSQNMINAIWAGTLAIMVAVQLMIVTVALHWPIDASRLLVVAIGGLFVGAGNFLGKSRPMALAGIRTRWTLANEDVWVATHRFGGKLMVAGGLIWIAAGLLLHLTPAIWGILFAVELIAALAPIGYSYFVRRA